jgi:hypothetical protein
MNIRCLLMIVIATLTWPISARAHDVAKGPNGGPMITVQDKHAELTVSAADIGVHISDAKHVPIATTNASGRAVIQMDGKTTIVPLVAGPQGQLVGKAPAPIATGARVVVSATLADGSSLQARFVVP